MGGNFDPWAGKHLGEPEAPQGFDEFWQGVAPGGNGAYFEQQAALAASGGGWARGGGGGKGGGRGRGRFQRYSVPEPRAPRARPSHFVAIRLYSRMIRRNVQQMQQWFIDKDPRFEKCVVPVRKIHSSLLLTSVPQDRRDEAREACREAGQEIRTILGDQPIKLTCSGVGSFNGQVLFARIRTEPHEMLQVIHDGLSRAFMRHGFPVLDESAKNWLNEGEDPHDFKAHASFIKVSKAMVHANPHDKKAFRDLRVTADDIEAWKDVFFGTQLCHDFELLDMVGTTRDGYYPCMQLEKFSDGPVGFVNMVAATPLAAGPLRAGRLRVEVGEAGAGLEMVPCSGGYRVEHLLEWPGQPDLREGDAIIAIGGEFLHDLDEAALEERFRKHFSNGAAIIVGKWDVLQKTSRTAIARAAERLISPWKRAQDAASDVGSDSVSLYTEGGTRLRGRRYQLRTSADSYTPDPLSQLGADPWAKAAEEGYEYPEYTGSGTCFQKKYATRVDSSRFRKQALPGSRFDADGACHDKETTRVHQRLRKALHESKTHDAVLGAVHDSRSLLSVSNRSLALVRLAACGFLRDELRRDQRLRDLLADLEEDLEAVLEADASLAPALLGSLALALGRLGLKKPELFRALASIARRMGIWTFHDEEVAALLEGFSRARLIDEVLFQEVSRLVVARVQEIPPRMLTTILTAFASSNVATENMFFAAGDSVVACIHHFTAGQLAELAEAFSRVRARHALLVDVVPSYFEGAGTKDRRGCSIEALVKLFSAYVDARQDLGPEGFRETLADSLASRRDELSARLMRQVLQAAGRGHWPHAVLLDVAAEVAHRDSGQQWEIDAMHDCLAQLRVLPPPGFPEPSPGRGRGGQRHGRGLEEPLAAAEGPAPVRDVAADAALEAALRLAKLNVSEGSGAGLEMVVCEAGYLVEEVLPEPGQPDIVRGDVIVAIGGRILAGLDEDEVEWRFGAGFGFGALLVVGRGGDALHRAGPEAVSRAAAVVLEREVETVALAPTRPAPVAAKAAAGTSAARAEPAARRPGRGGKAKDAAVANSADPWLSAEQDPWAAATARPYGQTMYPQGIAATRAAAQGGDTALAAKGLRGKAAAAKEPPAARASKGQGRQWQCKVEAPVAADEEDDDEDESHSKPRAAKGKGRCQKADAAAQPVCDDGAADRAAEPSSVRGRGRHRKAAAATAAAATAASPGETVASAKGRGAARGPGPGHAGASETRVWRPKLPEEFWIGS